MEVHQNKHTEPEVKNAIFAIKIICDVMEQNQSHVAKHETAQNCILSENVKIYPFFIFIKNEIFV